MNEDKKKRRGYVTAEELLNQLKKDPEYRRKMMEKELQRQAKKILQATNRVYKQGTTSLVRNR